MERASTAVYKGIKGYWRRKTYDRRRKRKLRVVRLNPGGSTRRRFWRLNLSRRLKLKLHHFSPKKFLLRLRDAYVNLMMRLANSAAGGAYSVDATTRFGLKPAKEYDERLIVEIYKSIAAAQGNLVPRDAAWVGSEIANRRR